jgi:hypothetical protein
MDETRLTFDQLLRLYDVCESRLYVGPADESDPIVEELKAAGYRVLVSAYMPARKVWYQNASNVGLIDLDKRAFTCGNNQLAQIALGPKERP